MTVAARQPSSSPDAPAPGPHRPGVNHHAPQMTQAEALAELADDTPEPIPGALEGETREQMLARGKRTYHKLVDRRRRFVDEYLLDGNKTQAAKRAGYQKPGQEGHFLLKDPSNVAAVEWRKTCFAKFTATPAAVLEQLTRIALADVRELFDDDGNLLPVHELPEDVALIVQEVDGGTVRRPPPRAARARGAGALPRAVRGASPAGGRGDPRARTAAGGGGAVALARSILMRLRDVRDREATPAEV